MSNYEIMILTDPKFEQADLTKLLTSVLSSKETKIEKLERTELAYQIKKHKRANYFLVNTKTDPQNITELVRKLNISKHILRNLIINLDTEKSTKQKRIHKKPFNKSRRPVQHNNPGSEASENAKAKQPEEVKASKTTKRTTKAKKEETK